MKKMFLALAACAVLASCQQKGKTAEPTGTNDSITTDSLRFEGVLPAADGPGIRYQLTLADDGSNGFSLVQTYLEAENGKDSTFCYTGIKEDITKTADGKETKGIKLPLGKDGTAEYFIQVNDSTLRMVNEELEEAASELNYDLTRK